MEQWQSLGKVTVFKNPSKSLIFPYYELQIFSKQKYLNFWAKNQYLNWKYSNETFLEIFNPCGQSAFGK